MTELPADVAAAAESAGRRYWGRVLAGTLQLARDLDVAEEATADAFALALETWGRTGVPESVEAWLLTVARRRAIDRIRRAETLRRKLDEYVHETGPSPAAAPEDLPVLEDDELRLLVLCVHPALAEPAQIALMLRLGCGVSTEAIAAAQLTPPRAMAARLTRAKARIARAAGGAQAAIDLPDDRTVDERLPAVRRVIWLAYCLGHTATAGGQLRDEALAGRALRLAKTLLAARPSDPENKALLAAAMVGEARSDARFDEGEQVLFDAMNRERWDAAALDQARACLPLPGSHAGPFTLRAAIALERCRDSGPDWWQIIQWYGRLLEQEPNPVLALGRCEAIAHSDGPAAGLADLDAVLVAAPLDGYPYAAALRARLLEQLGRPEEARREWVRAASVARSDGERRYFTRRAEASGGAGGERGI